jgi:hypothetical protein
MQVFASVPASVPDGSESNSSPHPGNGTQVRVTATSEAADIVENRARAIER